MPEEGCSIVRNALRNLRIAERREMIAPEAELSVSWQCALLGICTPPL
jgi:hypothetical protein